jgi:two-component system, OmpR family, phosphate regulon sensor histidine kinase PhoR
MDVDPVSASPSGNGHVNSAGTALHAGLEQFSAVSSIFDAAEMVLYVADFDTYELLFMNAQAELNWGQDWARKRCYTVLQAGQSSPCDFCTNARLTHDGRASQPVTWEFQNTFNGKWYLCIDKAIPWSDGRLVRMEVAIDITERKSQERFREQYVGMISHDLRSPLSTIGLSAAVLKRVVERAGLVEAARPVDAITRNTRRMSEMIEDLLETTRLEAGQLQLHKSAFDLGQLAATVAGQLGTTASRPIHCDASGLAPVLADSARIERVLDNLVGNALRYSAPDSPVCIRVESSETEALVTVVDRGIGMPAEVLPQLFQRFYRASGNGSSEGLGLGLYNSRLIVEQHGGRIWAQSSPGVGSTFGFALPMAPVEQVPPLSS